MNERVDESGGGEAGGPVTGPPEGIGRAEKAEGEVAHSANEDEAVEAERAATPPTPSPPVEPPVESTCAEAEGEPQAPAVAELATVKLFRGMLRRVDLAWGVAALGAVVAMMLAMGANSRARSDRRLYSANTLQLTR